MWAAIDFHADHCLHPPDAGVNLEEPVNGRFGCYFSEGLDSLEELFALLQRS
jgi:hypothetical protein